MTSINPPWSLHIQNPLAPYHSHASSPTSALSMHFDEVQIRANHCQILLLTLKESCNAVQQLRECGQLPASINLQDWSEISRKQDDIRTCLEKLQHAVEILATELTTSREDVEEKRKRSSVKTEVDDLTANDVEESPSCFSYVCNGEIFATPPTQQISEQMSPIMFDDRKFNVVSSVSPVADGFLEHIADLTLAQYHQTPPDILTVIKSLRQRNGAPVDLVAFHQVCEQSATEGLIEEIEWKLRNRIKLTELAWQMPKS
ncbi:hypothetical protein QFC19_006843 [Naganishia cerealis]|uniref:Uncharacterized protein n=1 Tax=Naganishia cerealis TaxID=610337 RepID=A0ACC2VD99_9TREE|nr:hypothetical protein QFC19_006843 [Naganishia cerealis]